MIFWLTTLPHHKSRMTGFDAGQRGWRLHAVEAPQNATKSSIKESKAMCGLIPSHGWGLDLFIEEKCKRCLSKIDNEKLCSD